MQDELAEEHSQRRVNVVPSSDRMNPHPHPRHFNFDEESKQSRWHQFTSDRSAHFLQRQRSVEPNCNIGREQVFTHWQIGTAGFKADSAISDEEMLSRKSSAADSGRVKLHPQYDDPDTLDARKSIDIVAEVALPLK